jgi:hypothetical protein
VAYREVKRIVANHGRTKTTICTPEELEWAECAASVWVLKTIPKLSSAFDWPSVCHEGVTAHPQSSCLPIRLPKLPYPPSPLDPDLSTSNMHWETCEQELSHQLFGLT